jgi:hypothetical protein
LDDLIRLLPFVTAETFIGALLQSSAAGYQDRQHRDGKKIVRLAQPT